jgi:hypothetical protein
LHFDANERLHSAVVKLTHQARALERSRAPAKAPDQVDVVNRRSDLANQVL